MPGGALSAMTRGRDAGGKNPQDVSRARQRAHKKRRRSKAKPNKNAPLGQGGRFAALEQKLSGKKGVTDPGALAAAIGRKKYGKKRFAAFGKK
jgi:hypothetical protein